MSLFIKKKEGGAAASAPPAEKDFSLLVARTTNAQGEESVSELLVPNGPQPKVNVEAGRRGLFIRKPKDIEKPARLPAVDVTDVVPVEDVPAAVEAPPAVQAASPSTSQFATPPADGLEASSRARNSSFSGLKFMDYQPSSDERAEPTLGTAPQSGDAAYTQDAAATREGPQARAAKTDDLASLFASKRTASATPKAAPTAKKKSLFGFPKKQKTASVPASDAQGKADSTDKAPAASPLFSRARKAQSDSQPKAPEKASAKVSRRAGPKDARAGELAILVSIEGHGNVFYVVTPNGLREAKAEELTYAASFSPDDHRYPVEAKSTYQHGVDIAMSEIGEDVRIVHSARSMGAVYATPTARIDESPVRLGPGQMLVEHVLKRNARPPGAFAVNLMLEDAASGRSLAILYYVSAQGDISAPQVSVNPSNLQFTLSEFLHKHGAADDADVLQLTNDRLAGTAGALSLYPNEAVWRGTPVRTLTWAAAAIAAIAALASGAYAGLQQVQIHALQQEARVINARVTEYDHKSDALISSSLNSFAQTQSLDVARLTDRAAALWVPRSTVSVDATAGHELYTLVMPVDSGEFFNNKPSVLRQLQNQNLQQLLGLTPPEGCTKNSPGVSGGVNVLQITVDCEAPADGAGRYRLD